MADPIHRPAILAVSPLASFDEQDHVSSATLQVLDDRREARNAYPTLGLSCTVTLVEDSDRHVEGDELAQ